MAIHLEGNNAPVTDEGDAVAGHVVGSVPADLAGTYYRNGPNPRRGWSPHLFAGDGMVHAIEPATGRYRCRWVRTPLYEDPDTPRDLHRVTTANTHVIEHAGRLLALEEGGLPYELTAGLDTVGPFTFGGAVAGPVTAHPKRCPVTGELVLFGYSVLRPHLTYGGCRSPPRTCPTQPTPGTTGTRSCSSAPAPPGPRRSPRCTSGGSTR